MKMNAPTAVSKTAAVSEHCISGNKFCGRRFDILEKYSYFQDILNVRFLTFLIAEVIDGTSINQSDRIFHTFIQPIWNLFITFSMTIKNRRNLKNLSSHLDRKLSILDPNDYQRLKNSIDTIHEISNLI